MLSSLIEALNGIVQNNYADFSGTVERGNNADYEYEVWCENEKAYFLKVRPLYAKKTLNSTQIAGSFESTQDAISYFRNKYV